MGTGAALEVIRYRPVAAPNRGGSSHQLNLTMPTQLIGVKAVARPSAAALAWP